MGLTIESYEKVLGPDKKIVRAMPNTPAAVQAGLTAFTFGPNVTEEDKNTVLELFSLAGGTAVLPERLMNAVSALTGSSPAYVYMFIEAMADGGCYAGIPRDQAYQMAAQAVLGAAKMVLETGKHPAQLKDEVERLECELTKLKNPQAVTTKDAGISTDEEPFSIELRELPLSVRCYNCLKAAEIDTLGDLVRYSRQELMKMRNFGRKSLNEVDALLMNFGLDYAMYENPNKRKFYEW